MTEAPDWDQAIAQAELQGMSNAYTHAEEMMKHSERCGCPQCRRAFQRAILEYISWKSWVGEECDEHFDDPVENTPHEYPNLLDAGLDSGSDNPWGRV